MHLPITWLKEFIDIPWSSRGLADQLARLGIGVESLSNDVLDLEIAANRGDLLSVIGIARELHAKTGKTLKMVPTVMSSSGLPKLSVTVDHAFAPRYTTAVLRKVKVGPTKNATIPRRLQLAGMRPVNNIVDCTNYVMLELGQPTHAFDYHKVHGGKMVVRKAKGGETLVTLDGVERRLKDESYVIADSDRVIDLPGIMGGKNSEIDDGTADVVLQAAAFDPIAIRKTSKKLGLVTEASYRFERQVDYGNCLAALGRLVVLVQKEAGGKLDGVVDFDHTKPREAIKLPLSQIERLIGQSYERRKVVELLERLGCRVEEGTDNLPVVPPTWRPDLTIAVDLVEELARLSGYDTVTTQPLPTPQRVKSLAYETNESLKDELVERGLSEVMTYSLLGEKDLAVAGTPKQEAVAIANPLSSELAYFRPCLLPGLLKAAAKNPTYDPIRIFEIGRVATKRGESIELGILFAGRNAKQLVDLAKTYGLTANEVSLTLKDAYKLRKQAVYVAIGPLKRSVKSVHVRLLTSPKRFTVKPISKFPPVVRDISFIVSETIRTDEIKTAISEVSPQIYLVELFDEFKGTTVGAGRKSLAFHIYYQSPDKTLTKDEIDHLHQSVALLLATRYDAKVR